MCASSSHVERLPSSCEVSQLLIIILISRDISYPITIVIIFYQIIINKITNQNLKSMRNSCFCAVTKFRVMPRSVRESDQSYAKTSPSHCSVQVKGMPRPVRESDQSYAKISPSPCSVPVSQSQCFSSGKCPDRLQCLMCLKRKSGINESQCRVWPRGIVLGTATEKAQIKTCRDSMPHSL